MSAFDTLKLKDEINTILKRSGELMETVSSNHAQTKTQRNVLRSSGSSFIEIENKAELNQEFLNPNLNSNIKPRPHNLEDFCKVEEIEKSELKSTFSYNELTEDEEIWVMDIPKTIDPQQLKGQTLQLGNKSKFKLGEDRYCAVNRSSKSSLTCVFNAEDECTMYRTVNIKPAGHISLRRKLSGMSKKKLKLEKTENVPYPQNLKLRHPLFGIQINEADVKSEKKS